jgi:hypothetical protein
MNTLTTINETIIIEALIDALLNSGHQLRVQDIMNGRSGDRAAIIAAMRQMDVDHISVYGGEARNVSKGFVQLVYNNGNNGLDLISDYTLYLEPFLEPVTALVHKMEDGGGMPPVYAAAPQLAAALKDLLNWGREHTSPQDANSPHFLLVAAAKALEEAGAAPFRTGDY